MEPTKTKQPIKAKELSKWSMVIGAVFIIVMTILKGIWGIFSSIPFGLTASEIISVGISLAAVFSPVYLSIIVSKFTNKEL